MATFKKRIVKPGVYKTGKNKSTLTPVSASTIAEVANTGNRMIEAGLKIPAPFAHKDENGIVPSPLMEEEDQELDAKTRKKKNWNSSINAGFWTKFEIDEKDDSLIGYVDVPGDEKDFSSPAGKVGKTIKETSIFMVPDYEDGLGRKWKNAPWHVALVNNPVEPGQDNFELVKNTAHEQELAVAMAISMSDEFNSDSLKKKKPMNGDEDSKGDGGGAGMKDGEEASNKSQEDPLNQGGQDDMNGDDNQPTDDMGKLVAAFAEIGVILQDDTDESNLVDRLLAIIPNLTNKEIGDENMAGAKVQSSPVAMADSTNETKQDDPNLVVLKKKASALLDQHITNMKTVLKERIDALVRKGQVGRKYADEALLPQVEALAMSMEDMVEDDKGEISFPNLPLAMALDTLEHNVALNENDASSEQPAGTQVMDAPTAERDGDTLSEDEAKELYEEANL